MGLCDNNALVRSELGHLSDNHLSGSVILQMGPERKSSVLKIIFFLQFLKDLFFVCLF